VRHGEQILRPARQKAAGIQSYFKAFSRSRTEKIPPERAPGLIQRLLYLFDAKIAFMALQVM
jgi:hypothetical protein